MAEKEKSKEVKKEVKKETGKKTVLKTKWVMDSEDRTYDGQKLNENKKK